MMGVRLRWKLICCIVCVTMVSTVLIYTSHSSIERTSQQLDEWERKFIIPAMEPSGHFIEQDSAMQKRLELIEQKCQNYSKDPFWKRMVPSGNVWHYPTVDLYYCIVPKVGCTYWKRILRFLRQDFPSEASVHKPSDIDRTYVHYGQHPNIKEYSAGDISKQKDMANNIFMFTRDPYARLWSGYLDKYYLPDFWTPRFQMNLFANENPSKKERDCNSNMTFKDFLTAIARLKASELNEHFIPYSMLCSPCHTKYAVIGKMESFTEDNDYIFTKYGIRLQQNVTKTELVNEEIKSLSDYNFQLVNVLGDACVHQMDVAQRLWRVFQYNGYIDRETLFPSEELMANDFMSHPIKTFIDTVTKTISKQDGNIKSQKRTMMLEAYKEIPVELLDKIKHLYRYDFELFGYDPELFK